MSHVDHRPELRLLESVGGRVNAADVGTIADRARRAGTVTVFEIAPANGIPARSPQFARALARAVTDGLVRLDGKSFVLTTAGRQTLGTEG